MDEKNQYSIDERTGLETAICDDAVSAGLGAACASLNRRRTSGIMAALAAIESSGEGADDTQSASSLVDGPGTEVAILVDLADLGISHDEDGLLSSLVY